MRSMLLVAALLLISVPLVAPVALAQPGECMEYYYSMWIGPGTGVVMQDSCHAQVWVDGYEIHDLLA